MPGMEKFSINLEGTSNSMCQ